MSSPRGISIVVKIGEKSLLQHPAECVIQEILSDPVGVQ